MSPFRTVQEHAARRRQQKVENEISPAAYANTSIASLRQRGKWLRSAYLADGRHADFYALGPILVIARSLTGSGEVTAYLDGKSILHARHLT